MTKPTNRSLSECVRSRRAVCQSEYLGGIDSRQEVEASVAICQVCVAPASSVRAGLTDLVLRGGLLSPSRAAAESLWSERDVHQPSTLRQSPASLGSGSMARVIFAETSRFTGQPSRSTSLRPAGGRGKAPASSCFVPGGEVHVAVSQ